MRDSVVGSGAFGTGASGAGAADVDVSSFDYVRAQNKVG